MGWDGMGEVGVQGVQEEGGIGIGERKEGKE
jgi:hypothetical protein